MIPNWGVKEKERSKKVPESDKRRETPPVSIIGVCNRASGRNIIISARKWCREGLISSVGDCTVTECATLDEGLGLARRNPSSSVLLTVGFEPDVVTAKLQRVDAERLEIVIHTRSGQVSDSVISAGLLNREPNIVRGRQDPLRALNKALLRQRTRAVAHARILESEADYQKYFALRYEVWKELNYILAKKEALFHWELDYTDRTAVPVGLFSRQDELIGCGRLVSALGKEIPKERLALIEKLARETNDPKLLENFAYPQGMKHPYDVLEGFPGFSRFFSKIIRARKSNAELSRIIVKPTYQNQGLGEVIVDSVVSAARAQNIAVVFLACLEKHHDFYEASGFKQVEGLRCDEFVDVNVPAIAMVQHLS
ncbi:MAG: GNAT family N-acetyltransferase [Alphaproteobacteria bacterium]|nr:GNAT family N-acetyltransferase [Alphaproteobacteria bacterium]